MDYGAKKENPEGENDANGVDETLLDKIPNQRIVPFVEDHRNVLILTPEKPLTEATMATLQAALKRGHRANFSD